MVWSVPVAAVLSLLSASTPAVPDAFLDREPLPSCGAVLRDLVGRPEATAALPEVRCLQQALTEGAAAELAVQTTTREGGTIVYYYRAERGRPGLEIFVDASDDAYSGSAWQHAVCPHASAADVIEHLGGCAWT